jgi:DNA-binding NarL/FixJ family response regulator
MLTVDRPPPREDPRDAAAPALPRRIRVLVVDDHPAVRFGLSRLLEEQPDFEIAAVCIDADGAAARALAQPFDVAVIDYQLPGRNGLWLCRELKRAPDPPAVVVFSAFADHYLAACCAVAEADAVLNKGALGSELCKAVRYVARGRRLLPRVPSALAASLRRRLPEPDQLLFGMMLAAIPREEVRRLLEISEPELDVRISRMLSTLEHLPAEATAARERRGPLDLDRSVPARRMRLHHERAGGQ